MKKTTLCLVCVFILMLTAQVFADEVSPLQIFHLMKQVFPAQEKVAVFISDAQYTKLKDKINLAAMQNNVKAHVFIVESSGDIGTALNGLEKNSVLILFESRTLLNNTSKLYILSKCKEKQVPIVTTSKAYSDSGALVAVVKDQDDKLALTLNLKQNAHLKDLFTEELIAKIGFKDVIL